MLLSGAERTRLAVDVGHAAILSVSKATPAWRVPAWNSEILNATAAEALSVLMRHHLGVVKAH